MTDVLLPYVIAIISARLRGRDATQVHHLEDIYRLSLALSVPSLLAHVLLSTAARVSLIPIRTGASLTHVPAKNDFLTNR